MDYRSPLPQAGVIQWIEDGRQADDAPPTETAYFGPSEIAEDARTAQQQQPQASEPSQTQAESDQDGVNPAFVAQAIEGRSLEDDVAAAAASNGGKGIFYTWDDKVVALNDAYRVYLHAQNDEDAALKEAVKFAPFNGLKRLPKRGNPAYVATALAAKPSTLGERKACSDYATTLIWAAVHEVEPGDFIDRVSEEGLKNCVDFVRELRAKGKQSNNPDARVTTDQKLAAQDASICAADQTTVSEKVGMGQESDLPKPAPRMAILVDDEAGMSRRLTIPLSAEEAAAALAMLNAQQFDHAHHALGTLMKVLNRPERATRKNQRQIKLVSS